MITCSKPISMRKVLIVFVMSCMYLPLFSQQVEKPIGFSNALALSPLERYIVESPDWNELIAHQDDMDRLYGRTIQGRIIAFDITAEEYGVWDILPDGTQVWRLQLHSDYAMSISAYFSKFFVPDGSSLFIYNNDRTYFEGPIGAEENNEHGRYVTNDMWGQNITLEYIQPVNVIGQPQLEIRGIGYFFDYVYPPYELSQESRGSESCQVNINCPEGLDWQFQRDAVVRMRITDGNDIGLCSGAMVNTTARDCRQYVLSALHCAADVSDSDLLYLQFRWNYERPADENNPFGVCGTAGFSSARNRTGAFRLADSNDISNNGGFQGSDFLLLEVEDDIPDSYSPFFAGWDSRNLGSPEGVGIHHPAGDIKKISTYNAQTISTFIGAPGSHWQVRWIETETNHGTTEGGSSGSPLFNDTRLIIGTLSAGLSACFNGGGMGPNQPDWYGKMSYHWSNNPNTSAQKLREWLDPIDLGWDFLYGSYRNGDNNCDPSIGINDLPLSEYSFSIHPNPSAGELSIRFKGDLMNGKVNVYNAMGQMLHQSVFSGPVLEMDLSEFRSGAYYVTVQNASGYSKTERWVKL